MAQEKLENNYMLSSLKIDGKGWNPELFDTQKEDALCAYCNAYCCDAVELDCDHNDDEIFPYCSICLKQLISNKYGKCPINLHSEPIIHGVRSLRRQILQCIVWCPFSVTFKAKTKNNAQNDDELKCEWRGTLNDLITKHIIHCTQNSDPIFLLQSKLKDTENKNAFLNIIINQQKQKIIDLKKENDKLLAVNKNIETMLVEKNKVIEQYEKQSEHKHEFIASDTEDVDNEYWIKCGNGMTINESVIKYEGNYGYCTVYSSQIAENGIHEWKIKILSRSSECSMYIGIASTMKHRNLLFCGKGCNYDQYNIGYSGYDAIKINYNNIGIKYGEKFDKGDIITMCLDLNDKNISFKKNDQDFGVAFDNIYMTKYRLAISMYAWSGDNAAAQMISYVNK